MMIPKNITREHIEKAIIEIEEKGFPQERDSASYELIYNGEVYPPKYVVSLANKYANGYELEWKSFKGGNETNDFLEKLGFVVSVITEKPKVWIEMTLVSNRPERQEGEYALGRSLWSPREDSMGRDRYKRMREVSKNDVIFHLVDNSDISAISKAKNKYQEVQVNIKSDWDGEAYLIELYDFIKLDKPVGREELFNAKHHQRLNKIRDSGEVFYQRDFELRQGAYLTPCPEDLFQLINETYKSKTGENLPYYDDIIFEKPEVTELYDKLPLKPDLNTIFYGPPGTGKTYNVVNHCLRIMNPEGYAEIIDNPFRRNEAVEIFNNYIEDNRISFTTFHQSYSYEEFIEGLRINEDGGVEIRDGAFKKICHAAQVLSNKSVVSMGNDLDDVNFFKMSLGSTIDPDDDYVFEYCMDNNFVTLGWGGTVDYSNCSTREAIDEKYKESLGENTDYYSSYASSAINILKNEIKNGDVIIVSSGNLKARAIAKVTGDYFFDKDSPIRYKHYRQVEWLYKNEDIPVNQLLKNKTFSQMTIYNLAKRDLNMKYIRDLLEGSKIIDKNKEFPFVLVIDEINRGNISKIFGELITLIEPDKRLGNANELKVTLPYSVNEKFGVPNNVYVIGTMNTADRSIALLDTALRRRFNFIEMMPLYDILPRDIEGVDVSMLLQTMNNRIEYLFDRDHMIGHAYFLKEELDLVSLVKIMKTNIIPLLQEYFYEDWEKVELVLGGAGKVGDNSYFINKEKGDINDLFNTKVDFYNEEKYRYQLVENPDKQAFLNVYSKNRSETKE